MANEPKPSGKKEVPNPEEQSKAEGLGPKAPESATQAEAVALSKPTAETSVKSAADNSAPGTPEALIVSTTDAAPSPVPPSPVPPVHAGGVPVPTVTDGSTLSRPVNATPPPGRGLVSSDPQPTESGSCGNTVAVTFYDAVARTTLFPPDGTSIDLSTADGQLLVSRRLKKNRANDGYTLSLANLPAPTPNPQEEDLEEFETTCGTPIESNTQVIVMSSRTSIAIDCQSYNFSRFGLALATPESTMGQDEATESGVAYQRRRGDESGTTAASSPCSVAIPLTMVEQTYTLRVFTHDACFKDYLRNPKALLDNVEVKVAPIRTPASGTRARPQASPSSHQSARLTGKTVAGLTEISGLIPNQLYSIEYIGPKDYICITPPPAQLQNLCGGDTILRVFFQPCSTSPTRTIVFVQEACPGMRVAKLMVQAGNLSGCTDHHGILNLPSGTTGIVEFQASGKVFSPPSIDVKDDSPMVFTVRVADQQVEQQNPRRRRFQFVDERGQGFAHRQLRLISPGGYEEVAHTDVEGWFDGEAGWTARAEDDPVGFAAEFVLFTTEVG